MERLTSCEMYFDDVDKRLFYNKLKEYEDLEEQGLLVKLPFKAGDTVYHLLPRQNGKYVIAETIADTFFAVLTTVEGRFGNTVFLTEEEARQKLEELNAVN